MLQVEGRRPFWIRSASTDTAMTAQDGWSYRTLKRDFPGFMGLFSAYVLTLEAGAWPHEVHGHVDEEILIPLSLGVTMVEAGSSRRLSPGDLVFHTPWHRHTHTGVDEGVSSILALKWIVPGATAEDSRQVVDVTDTSLADVEERHGIRRRRIWSDRPLTSGATMTVEAIEMAPGVGYPVHTHDHDLVLVVTEGQLVDYGTAVPAPAVIYYPAGTPHGAAQIDRSVTRMIALEFHAAPSMPWLTPGTK